MRVVVASPSAGLLLKTGKEVAISGREFEEETVFGAHDDGDSQTTLKSARTGGLRPAHSLGATTSLPRHSPNIPLGGH